ncbi:hypothetical protein Tco_1521712, partial [Tanacetum coccineum]
LWELVKERFSSTESTDGKEKALWVELKRLFEPDIDDLLELQRYIHDPLTWRLYDASGVHHARRSVHWDSTSGIRACGATLNKKNSSMRMEQYFTNTDYALWQVILNGDGPVTVTKGDDGVETKVPPKTAQALL